MNPIIKVENLSKKYSIGSKESYYSLRDLLANPLSWVKKKKTDNFLALTDVSFEVNQGEAIGIIGRNGAGKSTLLKVLSQITPPTTGKITMRGRVASLLEVGTGFHPELTGRENIFLNGAILGMSRGEVKKNFDGIVAFAEVERFLDTPVKRYSSGMYVRLAFAVAAHLEPEILIVDEVLAVGDVQFQKKCLGKMQDVAEGGRTVLFVSHNLGAISQLCNRSIILDKGKIISNGLTNEVIKKYLYSAFSQKVIYSQPTNKSKRMNLRKVIFSPTQKRISNNIAYDEDIVVRIEYEVNQKVHDGVVWILLRNIEGMIAFNSADYDLHPDLRHERQPGYYRADVCLPRKWLSPDTYNISVGLNTNSAPNEIFDRVDTIMFNIIDTGTTPKSIFNEGCRSGIFQPFLEWKTKKIK